MRKPNVILRLLKSYTVLTIATVVAIVTCIFVPPDKEYLGYLDFRTLSCLFCTLAVVSALKEEKFFLWLANKIVARLGNLRRVVLALVFITYFGSMVMANDMALITFLPLGYYALSSCGRRKELAFTFVMQNVSANLGGMLTPFGNPQNLFMYSYFNIPTGEFFAIMALPFGVAFALIVATCFFIKPIEITAIEPVKYSPTPWRVVLYLALFVVSIMIVFRVFPYYIGLAVVTVAIIVFVPRALLRVDYGLLLTFVAFFIFSGNLSRIDVVANFLGGLLATCPLLVGTASCQVISNVPSAVLLSRFTTDYRSLLLAVNIGGLGTPIASLASLITLGEYRRRNPFGTAKYLALFLGINFAFMAILLGAGFISLAIV